MISPFVGRINDGNEVMFKTKYTFDKEPGVILVKKIYNYLKKFEYKTIIMVRLLIKSIGCIIKDWRICIGIVRGR